MICEHPDCSIEHQGNYGSGRFCSEKCSRSFSTLSNKKAINEKKSKTIKEKYKKGWQGNRRELVTLQCPICQRDFEILPYLVKRRKFCSRHCSHVNRGRKSAAKRVLRSKNEIQFSELCLNHFENVLTNKPIFNGWDADVIIEDVKVAVLWNGKWHYEDGLGCNHSLKQVQNRDRIKLKEIKKSGYTPYIIKDMGRENPEFVEKEFKKFMCSYS